MLFSQRVFHRMLLFASIVLLLSTGAATVVAEIFAIPDGQVIAGPAVVQFEVEERLGIGAPGSVSPAAEAPVVVAIKRKCSQLHCREILSNFKKCIETCLRA